MDYIFGKLLVDPQALKYDTLVMYGFSLGLINGCFLCARFFPYNPKDTSLKNCIIRGIIGSISTYMLLKYAFEYIVMNNIALLYAISYTFLMGIIITLIYPIIFTKLEKFKY